MQIGLHVGHPTMELDPTWGGNSLGGGLVLTRYLTDALMHAGAIQLETQCAGLGRIEDFIFKAWVEDYEKALPVMLKALTKVNLQSYSQLGVRIESDWHCVHPSPEVRLNWLFDNERHSAEAQQLLQQLSRAHEILEQFKKEWILPPQS